jgi:hypothetical protein
MIFQMVESKIKKLLIILLHSRHQHPKVDTKTYNIDYAFARQGL